MTQTDWSINEIVRLTGTTSRTLRHYDSLGLLSPSRIAANGYRHYDEAALVRLQRILLLRELGLGLPAIGEVLKNETDAAGALTTHLHWLRQEQNRLARQIVSVETTITKMTEGDELMAENMFDGFDHTQHKDEVEKRWGADAYATSDAWWRSMDARERAAWTQRTSDLARDWSAAAESGESPDGAAAHALAARHVAWLAEVPGTPRGAEAAAYIVGLGDMYVADERFAANYGGEVGATFVRDALRNYVERELA